MKNTSNILKIGVILNIILLFSFPKHAFSQQYGIKNYGVAEGLGQSQVHAISQDSFGYLWVGTLGGGISRFDGSNFINFTKEVGLASNFVLSIQTTAKEEILVGTTNGLSKITKDSIYSNFTNSPLDTLIIQDIQLPYIATSSGLFLYENGVITRFEEKNDKCGVGILQIAKSNSKIWGATNHGVIEISEEGVDCRTNLNRANNHNYTSIIPSKDGGIWAGSLGGGISKINTDGSSINFSKSAGLETYNVSSLLEDTKGNVWIGSKGQGLSIFNGKDFTKITSKNGLANDFVNTIFQDKNGIIWLGTSNGLSKYSNNAYILYDKTSFLPGGGAHTVFQDKDGTYWFACFDGGVVSKKGAEIKQYNKNNRFTSKRIRSIFEDRDGVLWFGSDGEGMFSYSNGSFKKLKIGNVWVSDIKQDKEGVFYIATLGNGLYRMHGDTITNHMVKDGNSRNRINKISIHSSILLATDKGAYQFIQDSIYFIKEIPRERFTTLVTNKNGTSFFGNVGKGIFAYANGKLSQINKSNGLVSDNVYAILPSKNGLWVGTEKGVEEVELQGADAIKVIKQHNVNNGFLGIEIIRNGMYQDQDKNYWFATVNGLVKYTPQKTQKYIPKISLTGLELFYEPLDSGSVFGSSISILKNSFAYTQNHFTFRFQGLDFNANGKLLYRWRLLGLDDIWTTATSQNFATYPNLHPGKYTFEVQVKGKDNWSQTANQTIVITNPYWKETWFLYLMVLIGLATLGIITWGIFRSINKRNKSKNEQLQMERKMIELEQQALRLQMNPHFLFNSLNAIKGAVAQQQTKEAKRSIDQFAKLMRALLENTQEGYIPLYKELNLIKQYLSLELLNHEFNFDIKVEEDVSENVLIPGMIIQPLVENAVLHGISPLKENGNIQITFRKVTDQIILCEIEDNGIGREASQKAKELSVHKQTSRAMQNILDRLEIIKKPGLDIGLTIIDIVEEGRTGTKVQLKLPIK